jgi:hypothetical protein
MTLTIVTAVIIAIIAFERLQSGCTTTVTVVQIWWVRVYDVSMLSLDHILHELLVVSSKTRADHVKEAEFTTTVATIF